MEVQSTELGSLGKQTLRWRLLYRKFIGESQKWGQEVKSGLSTTIVNQANPGLVFTDNRKSSKGFPRMGHAVQHHLAFAQISSSISMLLFLSPSLPSSAYTVMWKQMDVINKFYGMLEVDECYGIRKIVWSTEEYWVESARGVYRWVLISNRVVRVDFIM